MVRVLGAVGAFLLAVALPAAGQETAVEPIKTIEIGKNREFRVNGKPFFPTMSWAQSPKKYAMLTQAAGFNTHVGNADPNAAAAVGCYAVSDFKEAWVGNAHLLGWLHGDEPDMARKDANNKSLPAWPRRTPAELAVTYQKIKDADKTRPVFVTFTGSFTQEEKAYDDATRAKIYPDFVKSADVVGFDIYPIYGSGHACHLDWVARGVTQLLELGGPKRPLYAWIETSKGSKWMTAEKQPEVLPMHTRCEVWMAIIRGATAIGYFTHAWRPPPETSFAPKPEMQKEMKRLNAQITRLSAAILADPAAAKVEMKLAGEGAELNCHCKATQADMALYIFAQNIDLGEGREKLAAGQAPRAPGGDIAPRAGKATIKVQGLKAGTKIDVVDEGRTITADDGQFSDDFAPLAEHVYEFSAK